MCKKENKHWLELFLCKTFFPSNYNSKPAIFKLCLLLLRWKNDDSDQGKNGEFETILDIFQFLVE
jgi:hypothetical protein